MHKSQLMKLYLFPFSGEWSNPSITGQCIPSASFFVIEKINNSRAVLFGGMVDYSTTSNDVYFLEISVSSVVSYIIIDTHTHTDMVSLLYCQTHQTVNIY